MKIISGTLKGRKIEGHLLKDTRPTMDRVKESIFAMIQDYITDSLCLDLFSGSGNLGIEAISQGARFVYFNDIDKGAIRIIEKNLANLDIFKKSKVLNLDYHKCLKYLEGKEFNLIFLDPPYASDNIKNSIELIDKYKLIKENGLIICESSSLDKIVYSNDYEKIKEKKYGDKWVVILRKI